MLCHLLPFSLWHGMQSFWIYLPGSPTSHVYTLCSQAPRRYHHDKAAFTYPWLFWLHAFCCFFWNLFQDLLKCEYCNWEVMIEVRDSFRRNVSHDWLQLHVSCPCLTLSPHVGGELMVVMPRSVEHTCLRPIYIPWRLLKGFSGFISYMALRICGNTCIVMYLSNHS